jgi:hypothetical protein
VAQQGLEAEPGELPLVEAGDDDRSQAGLNGRIHGSISAEQIVPKDLVR